MGGTVREAWRKEMEGKYYMNIRLDNLRLDQSMARTASKKKALNALLGNNALQNRRDVFVRSSKESICYNTYSADGKAKYISDDLLTKINDWDFMIQSEGNVHFLPNGTTFTSDQIPSIDTSGLQEIKAVDNCMDFGKNHYFKYVSGDGQEHSLYTGNQSIGSILSEQLKGAPYDGTLERYARFWNYVSTADDTVYMGLTFSRGETEGYLVEAGIQPGFFTVKMGETEVKRFYTTNKYAGSIQTQERYDFRYQSITATGLLLHKYDPGSVFRIHGKEYVLSENHTLDILYGEDIYDLEYPLKS